MAKKVVKPSVVRTRIVVDVAGLVGINWDVRKVSSSVYMMTPEFCKDLGYWMTRRVATIVSSAKPNGVGWTDLVCWPGRGMFLVKLHMEDIKES